MEADAFPNLVKSANQGDKEAIDQLVAFFNDPQSRAQTMRLALHSLVIAHGGNLAECALLESEYHSRVKQLRDPEGTPADEMLAEAAAFSSVCNLYIQAQTHIDDHPQANRTANANRANLSFARVLKEHTSAQLLPPKQKLLKESDRLAQATTALFQARHRARRQSEN